MVNFGQSRPRGTVEHDAGRKASHSGGKRLLQSERRGHWPPWRGLSRRERLILLLPALAAVIAVLAAVFFTRDAMRVTLEGEPVLYYGGASFPIQSGTAVRRTWKDVTVLEEGKGQRELTSLPIYFQDRTAVFLPQDMVYYAPRSGGQARLEYFSQLIQDADGGLSAARGGTERLVQSGFLYDGADLYVFLEPVTLTVNGYSVELSALSYVEAAFNGDILTYDAVTGEQLIETARSAVTARTADGAYTVSLLGDSMVDRDGNRTLLFTRPEQLDTLS